VLLASTATHGLMIASELALPTVTAHARAAEHHLVHGAYRPFFQAGVLAGSLAPTLLLLVGGGAVLMTLASLLALAGLLAFEHAYVQAGQAVPLA
jgi:MprA protease rhombosortase-interaction domain-containing protein